MKMLVAAALFAASLTGAAWAVPRSHSVLATHYTCEGRSLSRVAMTVEPAPCCDGLFGCPQLLSNTGLIKPKHANHT